MVAKARRAREVFRFIRINSPAYLRALNSDLNAFRDELVRTSAGLIVTDGWLVIALAGLIYARRALQAPTPFANLTQLLQRDLAAIERVEP